MASTRVRGGYTMANAGYPIAIVPPGSDTVSSLGIIIAFTLRWRLIEVVVKIRIAKRVRGVISHPGKGFTPGIARGKLRITGKVFIALHQQRPNVRVKDEKKDNYNPQPPIYPTGSRTTPSPFLFMFGLFSSP